MIKLLAFLWCGCWHKWKVLEVSKVYESGHRAETDYPMYNRYELQCERCGDVKSKDMV